VQIEVGGTFSYDVHGVEQKSPAVFLVGGVGITPIISM
jgi:ferredoxin-NADP reductase